MIAILRPNLLYVWSSIGGAHLAIRIWSAREDGGGAYSCRIHCEFISGLELTCGNALATGGGFHRVTIAEGAAAEVSPHTYL